jgi:hypothetical protein
MKLTPYQALVLIAADLESVIDVAELNPDESDLIERLLQRNHHRSRQAEALLTPDCAVPIRYRESFFSDHVNDFSPLRRLARLWRLALDVAIHRGDGMATVSRAICLWDLANCCRRGGLVVDAQVGISISSIPTYALAPVRQRLSRSARTKLIAALIRIDAEREPFETILARDREWEQITQFVDDSNAKTMGDFLEDMDLPPDVLAEIRDRLGDSIAVDLPTMHVSLDRRDLARLRLLLVDCALREYADRHGQLPTDLRDLVPSILPAVLINPQDDSSFAYRRYLNGEFELASRPASDGPEVSLDDLDGLRERN